MKKKAISATSLRIFMIILFVLLVILSIGGFYYIQGCLNDQALLLNQNDSSTTSNTTNTTQLSPQQAQASIKAAGIFETSNYQTSLRRDLDTYANKTNLTIASIEAANSPKGTPMPTIGNVTVQTMKINLKEPVKSPDLIKFIKAIESNLPIIRITSLKISSGGNIDKSVKVDELIVQVYIKG